MVALDEAVASANKQRNRAKPAEKLWNAGLPCGEPWKMKGEDSPPG
jgi:hypothetical protein